LEEEPLDAEIAVRARFERARLLEESDRWAQARTEYHTLASIVPGHARALEAMLRLVRYHLARGERALGLTEARRAMEALDLLIATYEDDSLQVRAGQTRAILRLETGDVRGGCGQLAALLRRYPEAPLDAMLLMSAAEQARTQLEDGALALELYRAAAVRAADTELRRRARAEADRLAGATR
jgi:hypothetical protein